MEGVTGSCNFVPYKMSGCVCIGCGQKCLIPFYQLKDGFFHLDCFRCSDLHNKPYFLLSGKLVCYDDIKAACCHTCQSIIRGDRIITQFGDFHKECFQCARINFTPASKFYIGGRKFFCHECRLSLKRSSHPRKVKAANEAKDLSEVRKKIEQYVKESSIPIPKHFNEELRIRLAAQFKAVERHVVTSSRCESAAYGTDDDEKEANFTSDSPKLKQEKKKESQNVELGAPSPPPKPKCLKNPSVCIPNPSTGTNRMPPVAVGLSPKRGSCSPQSTSCSNQELSQVELSDRTSISKCSTLSKSQISKDPILSDREEVLQSPATSSNSPLPVPSPLFNNNQKPSQELKSVLSKRESESKQQLTQPTHGRANVNALVTAYEKISAQAKKHPKSGASTANQNSTKIWVGEIEGPKAKSRESQPTSKLPLQALSEPISPSSPTRFAQKTRTGRGVRWAFASTVRFGGTLLLLILSIVAVPISTLLCFQKWMTQLNLKKNRNRHLAGRIYY
ncbi:actin binding LIM protein 2 [Echinococcus multilocularis]|uniref:Actin binding LIM protein 2 n=1 Tax=Echinococcus multilocularis TaxID=6211 RepID=A0A068YG92_ECHMU|nr:actin binding LIM protein 2 [Echinococcus multilocularis]